MKHLRAYPAAPAFRKLNAALLDKPNGLAESAQNPANAKANGSETDDSSTNGDDGGSHATRDSGSASSGGSIESIHKNKPLRLVRVNKIDNDSKREGEHPKGYASSDE